MKIYSLVNITEDGPVYDIADGFVVVARTALEARTLASHRAGDEGSVTWLNPARSEIKTIGEGAGPARVVLRDFHDG